MRVGNQHVAEDLLSTLFLKVINKKRVEVSNIKSYLYKASYNLIVDHYRSKSSNQISFNEEFEPESDLDLLRDEIDQVELSELIKVIDLKLSKREKEIVLLRYMDELGNNEIAETLGIDESTVSSLLTRARKKLKEVTPK